MYVITYFELTCSTFILYVKIYVLQLYKGSATLLIMWAINFFNFSSRTTLLKKQVLHKLKIVLLLKIVILIIN